MAVSDKFDNEGLEDQESYWNVWYLTPRVFEKEEEDRMIEEARKNFVEKLRTLTPNPTVDTEAQVARDRITIRTDKIVAHWDPELYRSKIWPLICLFGVSFGALHLSSWNTRFPTAVEMWLWRGSAFMSVVSLLVFMHFEKVVLRWNGVKTIVSLASPALYLFSRILMMGEVFAALRGEDPAIYDTYDYLAFWVSLL